MDSTGVGYWLERAAPFKKLICSLQSPRAVVAVSGLLSGGGKALILAALAATAEKPIAYLAAETELDSLVEETRFFYALITNQPSEASPRGPALRGQPSEASPRGPALSHEQLIRHRPSAVHQQPVVTVPPFDVDPYRDVSPHPATLEARAHALYGLSRGSARLALIPLKSLLTRTAPPATIVQSGCELRVGQEVPFETLTALLPGVGYRQEDPVTGVGEFSLRGGILDVFTSAHPRPLRLEFFGDELESMREFDPDTQRSVARLERAVLTPMTEVAFDPDLLRRWTEIAQARWVDPLFRHDLNNKCALAEVGEAFQGWEFQAPLVRPYEGTLFDYLPDAVFVLDEPMQLLTEMERFRAQIRQQYEEACEAGQVALSPETFFLTPEQWRQRLEAYKRIDLSMLGLAAGSPDEQFEELDQHRLKIGRWPEEEIRLSTTPGRRFQGRIEQAIEAIKKAQAEQMTVWVVARSGGSAERLASMLRDYDLAAEPQAEARLTANRSSSEPSLPVQVLTGSLARGFTLPWARLAVLAEGDIFREEPAAAAAKMTERGMKKLGAFLSDFRDLKPGDYVVHIDHGIGRFQGLTQLGMDGATGGREFLLLQYADGAKLYLPVERLDVVQKYSSADGGTPSLDRLGGTAWERTKARARRVMRDMTEELLKLYAERNMVKGFAFGPDSSWQREFEAGFEHQLTPDQEAALAEIKDDMERPTPMDRLLCGDVGFGKTEVALRAAFKAVMDGKQVAVLAPTTVLTYQHLQTFQRRLAAFPMKVELLSRFRSARQQKQIVSELADGLVDIVIGTHRLLSQDIAFRDLGLLIVDEEQRFGVTHKERLKRLRRRVDVLTLSATPIPRTLSMSLMGLKPMSVIETPPRDRLAIQTVLTRFSSTVIKTAIERELERDGQIFFVHNRIDSITTMADMVRRLAPQARIGVSHAEMTPRALEDVMLKFIRHELDLLVSTTVIENGIDIPLANTIIINHAERLGLAELYQLRGRVGRSNRRAYAYLLIPDEASLTPVARRRLAAIKEFSDLGAGFRLAAMDMELRGAGNLLGGEQSGQIRAIGFELYCQMLERTMRELKGEVIEEEVNTQIDVDVEIRIPEAYIPDVGQRLRIYKRVSSAPDERRRQEILDELLDRYGAAPTSVQNLMEYARLRRQALDLRVLSLNRRRGLVHIKFDPQARVDSRKVIEFVNARAEASFTPDGVLTFKPVASGGRALLAELKICLMSLR